MKKKTAEQMKQNKTASQQSMMTDKLKYEVGQEMGINPKTKNKKS